MSARLAIRSRRVVTPDGERPALIVARDGVTERVLSYDWSEQPNVVDYGDLVIMPGLVDTHVHINEPGRTDWEGFRTATRAAAAGGITTIVDMPLNSTPATVSEDALAHKRDAAQGKCHIDVGFWGGVVPGNAAALRGLRAHGVLGFKCFMVPSGVEDFAEVGEHDLRQAMPVLAELDAPLLVHAESPGPIMRASAAAEAFDPRRYSTWLRSRPVEAELEAIELLVRLSREFGTRVHVVHVAAGDAIALIRAARAAGVRISAETCPHYLYFAAGDIPDAALAFKCAPPIRDARDRDRLLAALGDGDLDLVASDHSPAPPALKSPADGSFFSAWGGIASLQIALPVTWSAALRRGHTPADIARWMSAAPAALAGLSGRKGAIAPEHDADFVIWDPDACFTVDAHKLEHRHKITPYDGQTLSGTIRATYLRGHLIHENGALVGAPLGTQLLHTA